MSLLAGLVFGVVGLVIAVIIAFIIIVAMTDSNIIPADSSATYTVTNESETLATTGITSAIAPASDDFFASWNATLVLNGTLGDAELTNETLLEGTDYQVFTGNGSIGNLTTGFSSARIGYDWIRTVTTTTDSVDSLTENLTAGVNNVSSRIPTILLIGGIILILSVLAVLVGVWQKMRMGGSL